MPLDVSVAAEVPDDAVALGIPVHADHDVDLPAGRGRWTSGALAAAGFSGKVGQSLVLRAPEGGAPVTVLLGLGAREGVDAERWRRAAAALVRTGGEGRAAALALPDVSPLAPGDVGAAIAEGAVLAAYRFDRYKGSPKSSGVERVVVVSSDAAVAEGAARGLHAAHAVAWARDLINTPAGDLPPDLLAARIAARLADARGVSVEIWDETRIAEERLGGLVGVSRGSLEPPRFVRATYEPDDPVTVEGRVPHIVLVGKGITFDSGGLSLKTADGMTLMKTDMSGSAVVMATVAACADVGVRVKVTALAPITENMPGARALKPGDVLTIRNGRTIEVLNTDAEGRLVLADALSLAAEIDPAPDAIVDIATLTGAARIALGTSIAPLFGNDDALVERVHTAGAAAGERLWPMPLPDDYNDHIDSDIADMKNTGKGAEAGAIAAALLLARFVGAVPWAHLDIAGTGRSAESSGYLNRGGNAFGVRTLLELLRTYAT